MDLGGQKSRPEAPGETGHKRHYSSFFRRNGNSDFCKPAEAELPPESPIPPAVPSESEPATSVQSPKQMDLFEEKLLSKEHIKEHRIIGQLFETYWLVEFHEKPLYH